MTIQQIEAELREDAWHFGFYLGNNTLLAFYHDADIFDEDYAEFLLANRQVFAASFTVFSNNCLTPHTSGQSALNRAATWVAQNMLPTLACAYPIEPWELVPASQDRTFNAALQHFGQALAFGTLPTQIIQNHDYLPHLFNGGSFLEQVIMVFVNNLLVDAHGLVVNQQAALERATWCLLRWLDRSVVLDPPIAPWEINC